MNRTEYDWQFAVRQRDGFSAADLATINDAVFDWVRSLAADANDTKVIVDHALGRFFGDARRMEAAAPMKSITDLFLAIANERVHRMYDMPGGYRFDEG